MANDPITELERQLERANEERVDAEDRASRAKERAREADEAYRKLQLDLVAAKDEASLARDDARRLEDKLAALEADVTTLRQAAAAGPRPATGRPPMMNAEPNAEVAAQVEAMLGRLADLREMLASASIELSQLHADEVALGKKRTRVLSDTCAILARAVGATGQAPPPLPSAALEARMSIAPVVDISEVADLIESLRPPRAPKVE